MPLMMLFMVRPLRMESFPGRGGIITLVVWDVSESSFIQLGLRRKNIISEC